MKTNFLTIVVSLLIGLSVVTFADENIVGEKNELKKIESEVKESRARLDSLQKIEQSLQRKISNQDQKMSSDRKLIQRLSRELNQLRKNISNADATLQAHQLNLDLTRRRYLGNLRQFYMISQNQDPLFYSSPNKELKLQKQVIYLTALASFESQTVAVADSLLTWSIGTLDSLAGQTKQVSKIKQSHEVSLTIVQSQKQRKEKDLVILRRKTQLEADRIIMLERAAEEMAAIIARLEERRERDKQKRRGMSRSSIFATLMGQLLPPLQGKVVESYGIHEDPVTRLKSFAPGISIKGKAAGKVYSVASGLIAYAGELRGYGQFVIIQHDQQYYSTYAGLDNIIVSLDQRVQARERLGDAGNDGLIRFEIRMGRETLDPVTWLNIESL